MKAWIVKDREKGILLSLDYPNKFDGFDDYWWVPNSIKLNGHQIPQIIGYHLTFYNMFVVEVKIQNPKLCIQSH